MKPQEPKRQLPLPFAAKVEHLRHSLDNVQATIRLLDAKVAGVIAFTTFLIGFTVSKSSLIGQLKTFNHPWFLWLLFALFMLSFAAVLLFAILTQFPRRSDKITDRLWLLFPLKPDDLGETYLRDELARKVADLSEDAILSEFYDQLAINGTIMTTKLKWCKWLFIAAIVLVLTVIITRIASLLISSSII
jgi:hypothetical protein